MTSPVYANLPASVYSMKPVGIAAATGTILKRLVSPLAAAVAASPAPQYYGGQRLLDLVASSTSAGAEAFALWEGKVLTTQDAAGTSTMATTSTTITRITGSFITDGWEVGQVASCFPPDGSQTIGANEGLLALVTAVSATTLTVAAIGTAMASANLASGSIVAAMGQKFQFNVAANSGNATGTANVVVLNHANDNAALTTEMKFGPTSFLAIKANATVAVSPAVVMFTGVVERY